MVIGVPLHQLPTSQLFVSMHLSRVTHCEAFGKGLLREGEDEGEIAIGDKHFSLMPGIGTTNAILAVRPLRLRNIYLTFESYSTATVISKQIVERNMSGNSH